MLTFFRCSLVIGCAAAALAQTSLIPANPASAFDLIGSEFGRLQVSGNVLRLETVKAPAALNGNGRWAVQVRTKNVAAIQKGDTVQIKFRMRRVSAPDSEAGLRLVLDKLKAQPGPRQFDRNLFAGSAWKQINEGFNSAETFEAGELSIQLWMGFQPQVVEVSDISVVNLGQVALKSIMPNAYEGAQADAPWRKQAAERIDKLRKANLTVEVRDATGKPLSGATVQVRMKRHAFWFGSAVAGKALSAPGPDGDRYRKEVLGLFNSVVLENDLKWPQWESSPGTALEALNWLHTNGITKVRGHNLIWPGLKNMPQNTRALISDPPALRKRILDHIAEETAAVRGKVSEWDVINEPFTNFDVQKVLGDAEMIAWFQAARKQDASAAMFINDYEILSAGGADLNHQRHYFNTIKQLIEGGAPLDGIGMQAHLGRQLAAPARVLELLDRFGKFGKQIKVTEFDINIADEELQAAYTRDFMTAFFSHPSASGFLMWGFWEGRHWLPKGAMFRRDWSLKPNGQAYKDLVFRDWWTNADGTTGKNGNYGVRGFRGDYEVSVTWKGKSKVLLVNLDKAEAVIPVTIP